MARKVTLMMVYTSILLGVVSLSYQQQEIDSSVDYCSVSLELLTGFKKEYLAMAKNVANFRHFKEGILKQLKEVSGKADNWSPTSRAGRKFGKENGHRNFSMPKNGGILFSRNGKSYYFSYSPVFSATNFQLSWNKSLTWCYHHGMKLVSFNSGYEWEEIARHLQTIFKDDRFWVNAHWRHEGNAQASRLTSSSFDVVKGNEFKWDNGQQLRNDVTLGEGNGGPCVYAHVGTSDRSYYASRCDIPMYFMCEF